MSRDIGKIRVMVSASALFDTREENALWERDPHEYRRFMQENRCVPLKPGACFEFIKTLVAVNKGVYNNASILRPFEIALVTKNSFIDSGLRIKESLIHHKFPAIPSFFYDGDPIPHGDHEAYETDLLLTSCPVDAQNAIDKNIASAVMKPRSGNYPSSPHLRIELDFDGVIVNGDSELIYKTKGMAAYKKHEYEHREIRMGAGPYEALFLKLSEVARELRAKRVDASVSVNTSVLTARGGESALRAMYHMAALGIDAKHTRFLEGLPKAPYIKAHRPSLYVDDQDIHLNDSCLHIPCGKVLYPTGSSMFNYVQEQEIKARQEQQYPRARGPK